VVEVAPTVTTKNLYRLQSRDEETYHPVSREVANLMVEKGRAEWIGTDYEEERDAFVHYADRIGI
jgi:hypothetical protein